MPASLAVAQTCAGWTQFGCLILAFGSLFFWPFAMNADILGEWPFRNGFETVDGRVTSIEKTPLSIGGDDSSPGEPILRVSYRFRAADGVEHDGVSYTENAKTGPVVRIHYLSDNAAVSRIEGARRAPLTAGAAITVIFPLAGLLLAAHGVRRGLRAWHLLSEGECAAAKLVSKSATNVQINDKQQYKMVFEFRGSDSLTHRHVVKTTEPAKFEDEAEETLLYHPRLPERAVALDALPYPARVGEDGRLVGLSRLAAFLLLVLPLLAVLGNVIGAVARYG